LLRNRCDTVGIHGIPLYIHYYRAVENIAKQWSELIMQPKVGKALFLRLAAVPWSLQRGLSTFEEVFNEWPQRPVSQIATH
jgi:hypothetical protein